MFKLNPFKKQEFKIFIIGCQRSGTTLMRLILNSHPKIKCHGEVKAYSLLENYEKKRGITGYQIPIWTELLTEYDCIKKLYKKEDKIIFLFRDPKEVLASMINLGCYRKNCYKHDEKIQRNYLNFEAAPSVNSWLQDDNRTFKERFEKEIEIYKNNELENLFKGICYWNYKNESFFKIKKSKWNILPVHYSRLVSKPESEIKKIFNFLNINHSKKTLIHHKLNHDENLRNNMMLGNTDPQRKIDTLSLKKWERTLNKKQIELIEENTNFNYKKLKNYI